MKIAKIVVLAVIMVGLIAAFSEAGWLIYHKPEFKGKILDADTKQPIEGAVVVVVYKKKVFRFMPESGSQIMDVRETLTDKEGIFKIPSYTTIIDPLSWSSYCDFMIFKLGYGTFPEYQKVPAGINKENTEIYFTKYFGKEREIELWRNPGQNENGPQLYKIKIPFGIVELPKLKTREERIKAKPVPVGEQKDWRKQKMLIKAIREEWMYLYNEDPKGLYNVVGD